jgi:hypothetical protein
LATKSSDLCLAIIIITETQRLCQSASVTFVTVTLLVSLNVYALEIFVVLITIEFLVLVELTKLR